MQATGGDPSRERAYVSLVLRPEDVSERDIAERLLPIVGSDLPTLRGRARLVPPAILVTCEPAMGDAAVRALEDLGCTAFAPCTSHLLALGPTHKIRDLSLCGEGLRFELWREGTRVLQPDEIQVLVRARMSETEKKAPSGGAIADFAERVRASGTVGLAGIGWGIGGGFGLAAGLYAGRTWATESVSRDVFRLTTKLDLHTWDGTVYQIDGDKFGFQILGDNRGMSDLVNIDRMCEWFAALAPNAAIDPYFSLFKPPHGVSSLRLPNQTVNKDDPRFAFYSRWAALMYRFLLTQSSG